MWVDGNFNASSGVNPVRRTEMQFGAVLKPVVDILQGSRDCSPATISTTAWTSA